MKFTVSTTVDLKHENHLQQSTMELYGAQAALIIRGISSLLVLVLSWGRTYQGWMRKMKKEPVNNLYISLQHTIWEPEIIHTLHPNQLSCAVFSISVSWFSGVFL